MEPSSQRPTPRCRVRGLFRQLGKVLVVIGLTVPVALFPLLHGWRADADLLRGLGALYLPLTSDPAGLKLAYAPVLSAGLFVAGLGWLLVWVLRTARH